MIYLKEHKVAIIGISLLLVFIFVFMYIIFSIAFPDNSSDLYGNRLLAIEDYPIDTNKINATKDKLISTEKVNTVSYKIQGKIINFVIDVKTEVDKTAAKELGKTVLETFNSEEKGYYDIQVFITNAEVTDGFPVIGYKHHTTLELIWSNNSI